MRTRLAVSAIRASVVSVALTMLLGIPAIAQTDGVILAERSVAMDDQQGSSEEALGTASAVPASLDDGCRNVEGCFWTETAPTELIYQQEPWAGLLSGDVCTSLGVPEEVIEWEQAQARLRGLSLAAAYDHPTTVDWRSRDGQDWTTPVRSQGACGTCVAFATAAAIESRLEIALGDPQLDPDLSEAHLYFCGSGSTCREGWYPSAAMDFSRDTGVVDEPCYPYIGQDQSCNVCTDWESRTTKISGWTGLVDINEMKQQLAESGPFEATMAVYVDFYYYESGLYEYSYGRLVGFHAVTVVGYDDEEGYWIAKNSWGTDWGEDGWFRIAYGECGIDDYVYVPVVDPPLPLFQVKAAVNPDEGGQILSEPLTCLSSGCVSGTQATLTVVPQDGYVFMGWEGDVSGRSESVEVVIDSDKNVLANFMATCVGCRPRIFVPVVTGG